MNTIEYTETGIVVDGESLDTLKRVLATRNE